MSPVWRGALIVLAASVAACGHKPLKPDETHLSRGDVGPPANIPAPVQVSPVLPKPTPAAPAETYSVVVNNVRVQELLFALARDARLQVDIDPTLAGTVTLNAIDQTLPQLLQRIARQVDMRYELQGQTLVVMRDRPYLRIYRVDYANLARDAKLVAGLSMQVTASQLPGASASGGQNNSTATINSQSVNRFWDRLVENIKEILRETDRVLPGAATPPLSTVAPATQPPGAPAPAPAPVAGPTYLEAGQVIANPETGIINVRATSRQHERVQEFLDQVLANSRRQVLIEATVAEVALTDQYQRGIDWLRLRDGALTAGVPGFNTGRSGIDISQQSNATPSGFNPNTFVIGGRATSANLNVAIKLLESFGDVRILSSPKLNVVNNQFAVLKVVDNIVYFTVQTSQAAVGTTGNILTTVNTVPSTVPVGLVMTVFPQISEHDTISLNVRPSISRVLRFVQDPNPSLGVAGNPGNFIPEIQTREMESMLRMESGQIAVLGGLMEDRRSTSEDNVPGLRNIPGLSWIFAQKAQENRKTELVIFLRATVIRDASIEGDYRALRSLLPDSTFFSKPQPSRVERPTGPIDEAAGR